MTEPNIDAGRIPTEFAALMQAIAGAGATLAGIIRRGGDLGAAVGINADGDGQRRWTCWPTICSARP